MECKSCPKDGIIYNNFNKSIILHEILRKSLCTETLFCVWNKPYTIKSALLLRKVLFYEHISRCSLLNIALLLLCDNNKLFIEEILRCNSEFRRQLMGICWVFARVVVTTITERELFYTVIMLCSHPPALCERKTLGTQLRYIYIYINWYTVRQKAIYTTKIIAPYCTPLARIHVVIQNAVNCNSLSLYHFWAKERNNNNPNEMCSFVSIIILVYNAFREVPVIELRSKDIMNYVSAFLFAENFTRNSNVLRADILRWD